MVLFAALLSSAAAYAADCPAPPVSTAGAAICLAKMHLAKGARFLEVASFAVEERKGYWLVPYGPPDANVKGGRGTLRIDKATGAVDVLDPSR